MVLVRVEHTFDVPFEKLWSLIGDFGDMSKWTGREPSSCVQEGEGIGSRRILTLRPDEIIIDRLDAETENSYSYSILNPKECPLPFLSYRATLSVEPVCHETCKLVWQSELQPDNLSDAEARLFTENMYGLGISMMEKSLEKRA